MGIIEVAAVRFEFQLNAGLRQAIEHLPAVRNAERLAPPKGHVRDTRVCNLLGECHGLRARQFVVPALVGAGLLAAGNTVRRAPVGQLPGDKQWRRILIRRPAIDCQA